VEDVVRAGAAWRRRCGACGRHRCGRGRGGSSSKVETMNAEAGKVVDAALLALAPMVG
jgi:hypothetical protein